jgi:hypothetical protein
VDPSLFHELVVAVDRIALLGTFAAERPLCAVADGGTPRQLSVTGSGKVGSPYGTTACA